MTPPMTDRDLPAPAPDVRVKPLEWEHGCYGHAPGDRYAYLLWPPHDPDDPDAVYWQRRGEKDWNHAPSLDAAKAAAQADFAARVLACLDLTSPSVEAALRERILAILDGDQGFVVAEHWAPDTREWSKHDRCVHGRWRYDDCPSCLDAAIRAALPPPPAPPPGEREGVRPNAVAIKPGDRPEDVERWAGWFQRREKGYGYDWPHENAAAMLARYAGLLRSLAAPAQSVTGTAGEGFPRIPPCPDCGCASWDRPSHGVGYRCLRCLEVTTLEERERAQPVTGTAGEGGEADRGGA